MKDYYSLLGIKPSATKADIKKNYRLLAVKFHPDKSDDPGTEAKFIAITEAYEVLSDRKTRIEYDLKRWEQLKKAKQSEEWITAVKPPKVSLYTRRNLAQEKRAVVYKAAPHQWKKSFLLLKESLYITARFIYHILGISLLLVIGSSVISQLPQAYSTGIIGGIALTILVVILGYLILRILLLVYQGIKEAIESFSEYYGISEKRAGLVCVGMLILVLVVYGLGITQA